MNRQSRILRVSVCTIAVILAAIWCRASLLKRSPSQRSHQPVREISVESRPLLGQEELASETTIASRTEEQEPRTLANRLSIGGHLDEIRGTVLDPRSTPVVGAEVHVLRNRALELATNDVELQHEEQVVGQAVTDEQGYFAIAVGRGRPYKVYVQAAGFGRAVSPECYAGDSLSIRLQAAGAIFGTITRASDGLPIAGARVLGWSLDKGNVEIERVETDDLGSYRIANPEPGRYRIFIIPRLEAPTKLREPIEIGPGDSVQKDMAIPIGIRVSGQVIDASTHAPVEGAEVSGSWTFQQSTRTNVDGRYVLPGLDKEGLGYVYVHALGYAEAQNSMVFLNDNVTAVDFELIPGSVAWGRIVDSRGLLVQDACVEVSEQRRPTRSNVEGRFEIRWAEPSLPHFIRVRKEGMGQVIRRITTAERKLTQLDLGDIVLPVVHMLKGIAVDGAGSPVANVRISLEAPGSENTSDDLMDEVPWGFIGRRTVTGSTGCFYFWDLNPDTYRLEAVPAGSVTKSVQSIAITDRDQDVCVVLPDGMRIDGIVVDPSGHPLSDVEMRLWSEGPTVQLVPTVVTRPDGTFGFCGLRDGFYRLQAQRRPTAEQDAMSSSQLCSFERRTGLRAGSTSVGVIFAQAVETDGMVFTSEGKAAPQAVVAALDLEGHMEGVTTADDKGQFVLSLHAGTAVNLRASAGGDSPYSLPVPVKVGSHAVVLALPPPP